MSIFRDIQTAPPDPIFGLQMRIKKDPNPNKVDLTVGIYRDKALRPVIMRAVQQAEREWLSEGEEKTYLPITGRDAYLEAIKELVFGKGFVERAQERIFATQSLGGSGALRIGGDLLAKEIGKSVFLPQPTWINHHAIFRACGLDIREYPYYSREKQNLDPPRMFDSLSELPKGSIVLLHACCHNPSGCDLGRDEWRELSILFAKKQLIPFFDCAYLGFSAGVEEDAWPIRHFAEEGHELLIAFSCSKNFGLYGERTGALLILSKEKIEPLSSVVKQIIRASYSNPPRFGAGLVARILQKARLREMWREELAGMRSRVKEMRTRFQERLTARFGKNRFPFLENRRGMFTLLHLKESQIDRLIDSYSIYLTKDGRINLTGLDEASIAYVVEAIAQIAP